MQASGFEMWWQSICVHCKTCDIMDLYQIIDWVPPKAAAARIIAICETVRSRIGVTLHLQAQRQTLQSGQGLLV